MGSTTVEELAVQNEKLLSMAEDLRSGLGDVTIVTDERGIGQPGGQQAAPAAASFALAPLPAVPIPGLTPDTSTRLPGSRMPVPKFNGDGHTYPMCRTVVHPMHNPVMVGTNTINSTVGY